jgi:hypothetical protein
MRQCYAYASTMHDDSVRSMFGIAASSAKDLAELTGRAVLAVAATAYVSGVIIVNYHLRAFGVGGVGLARTDYIAAGSLWIAFVAIGWAGMHLLRWTGLEVARLWKARRYRGSFAAAVSGGASAFGLLLFSLYIAASNIYLIPPWRTWLAIGVILVLPVTMALFVRALRTAWRARSQPPRSTVAMPVQNVTVAALFLIGALLLYAELVYPLLLPIYGGGRTSPVILVLSPDTEAILREAAVPESGVWRLIIETDRWIAVTRLDPLKMTPFQDRPAVRIQADSVRAMISASGY